MTATLPRTGRRRVTPAPAVVSRVIVYARQSKDSPEGIERQIEDCTALAARHGWKVARIIRDNDTSASSRKPRPGYTELLAEMEAGRGAVAALAQAQDRLTRKPIEMEHLIDVVERTGAQIMLVRSMFDLTTAMGRAQARGAAVYARLEVETTAERQSRREAQAVEQGKPPRRRAFGYRPGGMEIDPIEGPAVAEGYRLLLAGSSLASIARTWNEQGLRTAFGRSSKEWTGGTVRKVLLNCRNAGLRAVYGEEFGPGAWPAIIPETTFRQAVALLSDPSRRTSGGSTARRHLGGGLYRCGRCDSDVKVSYRNQAGSVRVYHCRASKHLTRVADPIDRLVTAVIEERLARPDLADVAAVGESPEIAGLHAERRSLTAAVRRIEADYYDGEITARQMKEGTARKQAEIARVDARLATLTAESRLATLASTPDPVAAFRALDVNARQAVVDALAVITLLPARPGIKVFDPASVRIDWRS